MKNKRIIAAAMATGMAVSLAACGGSASTTDTTGTADAATTEAADAATGEGTGFTVQLGPNPETLDPALNAAVDGGNTLITIEEPLLIIDENNEIQPGQAESYEVSDDGLVWTFHLREPEVERRFRFDRRRLRVQLQASGLPRHRRPLC